MSVLQEITKIKNNITLAKTWKLKNCDCFHPLQKAIVYVMFYFRKKTRAWGRVGGEIVGAILLQYTYLYQASFDKDHQTDILPLKQWA